MAAAVRSFSAIGDAASRPPPRSRSRDLHRRLYQRTAAFRGHTGAHPHRHAPRKTTETAVAFAPPRGAAFRAVEEDEFGARAEEDASAEVWEARRNQRARDVVRAMLYGGGRRTDSMEASSPCPSSVGTSVDACLLHLPLPEARVPRSLLNLASSLSSSSPNGALRDALSPRRLRVPDVEGRGFYLHSSTSFVSALNSNQLSATREGRSE